MMDYNAQPRAIFSDDGRYRFLLTRQVNMVNQDGVLWIMLNPSTADEHQDDPTIRRCIGFSRRWGFGHLQVCNLSPLRATDPEELLAAPLETDEIANVNLGVIRRAAKGARLTIIACGNRGEDRGRLQRLLRELADWGVHPHYLRRTLKGYPAHPLYLPYTLLPQPMKFRGGEYAIG